ncbi:MAG: HD domain-containing protein [Hafnia sp.]
MRSSAYDNVIMDPVHGSIQIFDHEMKIINHELFQRLRFINQNDVLSLVFPGATHTRFAHSIGAMHLSQRIWDGIINQNARYRVIKRAPTRAEEEALLYLNQCVRIAILMHDCGHGAFSHQLEHTPGVKEILSNRKVFEKLWRGVDFSQWYPQIPVEICHEHYSVRAAHKILSDEIDDEGICLSDVISIMETTEISVSQRFKESCTLASVFFTGHRDWKEEDGESNIEPMISFLRCFISCEFDADKGDYMLRDALFAGVGYGNYDLDAMVNNLSTSDDGDWFGLVVNRKGLGALEDFVHSRFQMYRQVYNHKTSNGFELTLQMAIDEVLGEASCYRFVHDAFCDINEYCGLVDSYFWEKFRSYARKHSASACSALLRRQPMKFLVAIEDASDDVVAGHVQEWAERLGVDVRNIVVAKSKLRFSKINENYDVIRVRDKHPLDESVSFRKITEITNFFGKFKDVEVSNIYHSPWLS